MAQTRDGKNGDARKQESDYRCREGNALEGDIQALQLAL